MTARAGMADLILQLRGMTDAGSADYTQSGGTAVFWDDIQTQLVLDRHVNRVYREQLQMYPQTIAGGALLFQEYRSAYRNWEGILSGTVQFNIEDGTGITPGTALWAADYALGIVTFGASTGGSAYFVSGRSYDLYGAAADVWRTKAGQVAKQYDVSTDNHRLSRSQLMKQCMEMSDYYATLQIAPVTSLYRSDNYPNSSLESNNVNTRDRDRSGQGGW